MKTDAESNNESSNPTQARGPYSAIVYVDELSNTIFAKGPDGVTIDSGAVNSNDAAIINAAIAAYSSVYIAPRPAGQYYLEDSIKALDALELWGAGVASQLFMNASNNKPMISGEGKAHIRIHDLLLDGNKGKLSGSGSIIDLLGCTWYEIRNCVVRNARGYGVKVQNNGVGNITNNFILENTLSNVLLTSASDVIFEGNDVGGSVSGHGLFHIGGSGNIISNNKFYTNALHGVYVVWGHDHDFNYNRFNSNTYDGINVGAADSISIIGGKSLSNGGVGININDGSTNCTVNGVTVKNSGSIGILVNGSHIKIAECRAFDDQRTHTQIYPIDLQNGDYNTIEHNDVTGYPNGVTVLAGNANSKIQNDPGCVTEISGGRTGTGLIENISTGLFGASKVVSAYTVGNNPADISFLSFDESTKILHVRVTKGIGYRWYVASHYLP